MNMYHPERGAVSIYIALLAAVIITSATITLSGVLSVQMRFVRDIVSSERAFYAANSGIEEAQYRLFQLRKAGETGGEISIEDGEVEYEDETATYEVEARLIEVSGEILNCISSEGEHSGDQRRLTLRPVGC